MLEEKQGQFWNLHQILHKTLYPDFQFSSYLLMIEDFQIILQLLIISPEKKNRKSGYDVLLGIRCRFQNYPCFSSSIDGF